jgi:hypothetical protein
VGAQYLGDDVIMWTAQWGGRPTKGDVWQFTSSDHIDGYSERVDGNKVLSERFARIITEDTPAPSPTPEPTPEPQGETCEVKATMPIIREGDHNNFVKIMQTALIAKGFNVGWMGADGWYGENTKIALYEFCGKTYCDGDVWAKLLSA